MNTINIYEDNRPKRRKRPWWQRLLILALCAVVGYAAFLTYWNAAFMLRRTGRPRQDWHEGMSAEDYFPEAAGTGDIELVDDLFHQLYLNGQKLLASTRESPVELGLAPQVDGYMLQFQTSYEEDGSLSILKLQWYKSGSSDGVCNLQVTTSPRGNVDFISPYAYEVAYGSKVTVRDGVEISATGNMRSADGRHIEKCIDFHLPEGWYQIYGDNSVKLETMIEVLDFYFEHPIDYSYFTIDKAGEWRTADLSEYPYAFLGHYPTGGEYCTEMREATVYLYGDMPFRVSCRYSYYPSDMPEPELVPTYWEIWDPSISTDDNFFPEDRFLGDLDTITRKDLDAFMETEFFHHLPYKDGVYVDFTWDGYYISAQLDMRSADMVWGFLQELREGRAN